MGDDRRRPATELDIKRGSHWPVGSTPLAFMVAILSLHVVPGVSACHQLVVPVIDGQSLIDRVSDFEESRGYSPAGGYAGVVVTEFQRVSLRRYYLGQVPDQWPAPGLVWLLHCCCGEPGCWPLEARVVASQSTVTWSDVRQPHRPDRDYTGFGPFMFRRDQYEKALAVAANVLLWRRMSTADRA